jgi:hypothetical protein
MRGTDQRELQAWLEAEAGGAGDEADRRFATVFARAVPRLAPPAGMADRVVARLGYGRLVDVAVVPAWARLGVLALLGVGGTAAAAFWSTWIFDLLRAVGAVGPRAIRLAVAGVGWVVDAGRHTWLAADAIGGALAVVASTGPATAAIAANLTVAFLAAMALRRLLSAQEE